MEGEATRARAGSTMVQHALDSFTLSDPKIQPRLVILVRFVMKAP